MNQEKKIICVHPVDKKSASDSEDLHSAMHYDITTVLFIELKIL